MNLPATGNHPSGAEPTSAEAAKLLATALALRQESKDRARAPLSGKQLAVVSAGARPTDWHVVHGAATALGATVSRVSLGNPDGADLDAMARLMGRMYDAIACDGIDAQTQAALERNAGVPLLYAPSAPLHITRLLADALTIADAAAADHGQPTLCLDDSETRTRWQTLAGALKITVCDCSGDRPQEHACGFSYAADGTVCDDGAPALLAATHGNRNLGAAQVQNHGWLVQAWLLRALS